MEYFAFGLMTLLRTSGDVAGIDGRAADSAVVGIAIGWASLSCRVGWEAISLTYNHHSEFCFVIAL